MTLSIQDTNRFLQYRANDPFGGYDTFWEWASASLPTGTYNSLVDWYCGTGDGGMEGRADNGTLKGTHADNSTFDIEEDPSHPRPPHH